MAHKISKSFSRIGENIRKIRQAKKLSQADFAKLFDLARPSVGAYEEGRSEPKIETLIQIARYFSISIDVLLTRKLTISEIYSFDRLNKKLDLVHQKKGGAQADHRHTASIVRADQSFDYIVNHTKKDFISSLEQVSFSAEKDEDVRLFEHQGTEMMYNLQGLHPKDLLAAKRMQPSELVGTQKEVVILVTTNGILVGRCQQVNKESVTISFDNPAIEPVSVNKEQTLEWWKVIGKYTTQLNPPTRLEERVAKIESQLKRLSDKTGL